MITKLNHVSVFVLDQDSAYDFYVNKLGCSVKIDLPVEKDFRWLTVCPPNQPDLELTLIPVREGFMFSKESAAEMRKLVNNGTFGLGMFECSNMEETYSEMVTKGVRFKTKPQRELYGEEAIFTDDSGNWFSLVKRVA
jgi:catechol 2,3-dioxygenase-like lactoylglutathione lyase family enzyme